ncbi:MAG TPA: sugar transferase [Chloroflexota bacterium]|nr:sugar transferase [Chloroflexota bacterium]
MSSQGVVAPTILVDDEHRGYLRLKRAADVVLSAAALLVLSPVLLALAILIKLDSPGPVLFRQTRVGKDGKPFTFLKFRSMRPNADVSIHRDHVAALIAGHDQAPADGKSAKLERDPRITGIGRVLRKTSIDELPQLINVLRGEMSLVGPRPPIPYEVELYEEWYKRRFEALPGITGWWQVMGRNRVSFDDAMKLDIYYVDHMSLWFDLRILVLTPFAVLTGNGAG